MYSFKSNVSSVFLVFILSFFFFCKFKNISTKYCTYDYIFTNIVICKIIESFKKYLAVWNIASLILENLWFKSCWIFLEQNQFLKTWIIGKIFSTTLRHLQLFNSRFHSCKHRQDDVLLHNIFLCWEKYLNLRQ